MVVVRSPFLFTIFYKNMRQSWKTWEHSFHPVRQYCFDVFYGVLLAIINRKLPVARCALHQHIEQQKS